MIRAKFTVQEITETAWGAHKILMRPQYDPDLPEDQRFANATPSGELWMQVDNLAALEELELGRVFYLTFVQVDDGNA